MAKKIIGGLFGGKKKKAAAPAEETGPKVTPLAGAELADPKRRVPLRGPLAPDATILSDKLGS